MGSSKMAINSLLQDSPASPRAPAPSHPSRPQTLSSHAPTTHPRTALAAPLSGPSSKAPGLERKPTRSKKKDRRPLLAERAATSPQRPTVFSRTLTPTLPHNAVAQAQRVRPSPPLSDGSTLGSSTRTLSSTLSTPSGDQRPPLAGRMMTTPPVVQHRNSTATEKMDFLADLAAMQHPQQGQPLRNLRNSVDLARSPSLSSVSRRGSGMPQANDHPMSDAPTATLQPRTFTAPSLTKSELQAVADLTKQLSENTFLYESHTQLIKLLHQGLMSHILSSKTPDGFRKPQEHHLLRDLRQAREAMDSRFPVGEELWLEWIQDECMLAETIDDRIAIMDLCAKAVRDEVGSTKIWRLYGDWMWHLYRTSNDIGSIYESSLLEQDTVVGRVLAAQYWTEDEKVVGREVFSWAPMIGVWAEGVKATEWHIPTSHVVWDSYIELLLYDLSVNFSSEKVHVLGNLFTARLRQPHAAWDGTFQKFSQFVSKYDDANYENIMVSTTEDAADAKYQYSLRQEYEMNLQRASESGEKTTEWTVMTEYLEWEAMQGKKPKRCQYSSDLFVGLSQRANLRFPTDASLWEDHVDYLTEHSIPRYSLLQVAHNATRHCPWSGNLWSKRLIALEAAGNAFDEIEDVKHHATSSGLLEEVGGMVEVIKVYASWCGFLRRRAFAGDAGEDEIDVAEVGIRSILENVKAIAEKKYGKDFKVDSQFRVQRIYVKFLSQAGRHEEGRAYWLQLSATFGDRWEFWDYLYLWEMTIWAKDCQKAGKSFPPEHATAALERAIRQPNLDWPERTIEAYIHHCAQHESVQKIQEAEVEATRIRKQTARRRVREAAEAAAAQPQRSEAFSSAEPVEESVPSGKRKREEVVGEKVEVSTKRNRSEVGDVSAMAVDDPSTVQVKRDRENTTIIVKSLPEDTSETQVRRFFRDCGTILSLQLVKDENTSTTTATIEFESKEDVLTAQTKSMKSFYGTSIDIQIGTGTTLFVTNYPPEADEEYMRELFKPYGEVVEVRFPSLKFDTHRRFCYVQFLSSREAQAATQLDGKALGGDLVLLAKLSDPNAKKERTGAMEESREVYVGNVHWKAKEEDVKALFDGYGKIQHVRIPRNVEGRSKGAAFVVYATKEEALAAVEMNLKEYMGRVLRVTLAKSNAKGPKRTATTIINGASPDADIATHDSPMADDGSVGAAAGSPPAANKATASKTHHSRTLILRNIPDTVNDARIRALAEPFGPLRMVRLRPERREAIVEFVQQRDVGKAEMGLAGKEIAKDVLIEIGQKVDNDGGGVAATSARSTMTLPFALTIKRRPAQTGVGAGVSRRGGKGGLGLNRRGATHVDEDVGGQDMAAKGKDGDGDSRGGVGNGNEVKMTEAANGETATTTMATTAQEKGKQKSQADFRAMLSSG